MDINGYNVDADYRSAVRLALNKIENLEFDLVILQSRSPTLNCLYSFGRNEKSVSAEAADEK